MAACVQRTHVLMFIHVRRDRRVINQTIDVFFCKWKERYVLQFIRWTVFVRLTLRCKLTPLSQTTPMTFWLKAPLRGHPLYYWRRRHYCDIWEQNVKKNYASFVHVMHTCSIYTWKAHLCNLVVDHLNGRLRRISCDCAEMNMSTTNIRHIL